MSSFRAGLRRLLWRPGGHGRISATCALLMSGGRVRRRCVHQLRGDGRAPGDSDLRPCLHRAVLHAWEYHDRRRRSDRISCFNCKRLQTAWPRATGHPDPRTAREFAPITIDHGSWIAEHATVAASVGRECIDGAGSLVLMPLPWASLPASSVIVLTTQREMDGTQPIEVANPVTC